MILQFWVSLGEELLSGILPRDKTRASFTVISEILQITEKNLAIYLKYIIFITVVIKNKFAIVNLRSTECVKDF